MKTIEGTSLIDQLNWRYATKQFDTNRKIPTDQWEALEQALVLSPSSSGLQAWQFIVVEDPAVRKELRAVSWDQPQVTDASHLVVFAAQKDYTEKDLNEYLARISDVRGVSIESLDSFRQMITGNVEGKDPETRAAWLARQPYIALGFLLSAAAQMGIDACPMEGFDPAAYDKILGLTDQGLTAVVIATVGYRSSDDKYASLPKVRFSAEKVIRHV